MSSAVSADPARTFEVRHLQLARALFAAIAAIMVTFSPDHSATVGLAVFSGFGIATGLVLLLSAWLVFPAGKRGTSVLLGAVTLVAGMVAGVGPWRTTEVFFWLVIAWALVTGLAETIASWRARRSDAADPTARDGIVVGIITVVLGIALLVIPMQYTLEYYIEDAGRSFTLTGIIIAVGVFGGYAAIVAVYLAIAGLSPRRAVAVERQAEEADA